MKLNDYEKIAVKMADHLNASMAMQLSLIKEENERLKEIIKLQEKQIENLEIDIFDFFDIGNENNKDKSKN